MMMLFTFHVYLKCQSTYKTVLDALSRDWWHKPVIQLHGRLKPEDYKFSAILGNLGRPCLKKKRNGVQLGGSMQKALGSVHRAIPPHPQI